MKLAVILSLAFLPFAVSGQNYFEGSIHYAYDVSVKSKKISLPRLKKALGGGTTLLFKDGNFRHNYDGGMMEFDLYHRLDNRLYTKQRDNDTIYWYDCSKGGALIKDIKELKKRKEVLGIPCDQLRIEYPDHSKVEYYNSDSISIDPQWFVPFRRDEQYRVDAIEKSIFLRCETDYPAFTIVSRATRVERKVIDLSVFDIPQNAILLQKE